MSVALFFFSCQDETSLLGFKNPNKKFNVRSVDIPLGVSSVLAIDTLFTDLKPIVVNNQPQFVDGILVGKYDDPSFGKLTAQTFLSVYPVGDAALPATAEFDSITVQFRLNFYAYGFTGTSQQRFLVHEITGDTLSLYDGHRYYANSPAPQYSIDPLGQAVININYDSLQAEAVSDAEDQDTLLISGRLDQDYGNRIFELVKAGFTTAELRRLFKSQIKGLALIPGDEPGVLGMNVINSFGQLSRVVLHYHTKNDAGAVADTLERYLGFEYAGFTRIDADRMGTELDGLQPYESVEPLSGLRYIQSGAPVVTKVDLSAFYSFADTLENIIINEAQLIIDNVPDASGLEPHNSLTLRLMNNNSNQFLNNRIAADREIAANYYVNSSQGDYYYFAANEASAPAIISYDKDNRRISGFVTRFAQSLFANKNAGDDITNNRIRSFALYPSNPPVSRGISRTLFQKENLKLRVVYTRANTVTP